MFWNIFAEIDKNLVFKDLNWLSQKEAKKSSERNFSQRVCKGENIEIFFDLMETIFWFKQVKWNKFTKKTDLLLIKIQIQLNKAFLVFEAF